MKELYFAGENELDIDMFFALSFNSAIKTEIVDGNYKYTLDGLKVYREHVTEIKGYKPF